jgi:N-acetylglucosamine kinase-like BadF-type ATPase
MPTYLGIDGGGTATRAILVNKNGRVLGVGSAGPSNYNNVGEARASENLLAATRSAWEAAGKPFVPADAAFLGLAGVKSAADIARMTAAAEGIGLAGAGAVAVANDLHNALSGGLNGAPGIALIGGTGCNALGRDAGGRTFMCGGWGWLLGDLGAGFGLAAEGLRAATRAADGRAPATRLLPAALAFFGLSEPDELLARLYVGEWDPAAVAAFAPVVVRLAGEGDSAAASVLASGADALAGIVATVARTLDFPNGPDVVLLGGCITSGAPYQPLVEAAIRRACPSARLRAALHDPLHGAALNVLRHAGLKPVVTPSRSSSP